MHTHVIGTDRREPGGQRPGSHRRTLHCLRGAHRGTRIENSTKMTQVCGLLLGASLNQLYEAPWCSSQPKCRQRSLSTRGFPQSDFLPGLASKVRSATRPTSVT